MKIGNIFIGFIPKDNGLYGLAVKFEDFEKMLKKRYKVQQKDLSQLRSICLDFRKVGRREPHKRENERRIRE